MHKAQGSIYFYTIFDSKYITKKITIPPKFHLHYKPKFFFAEYMHLFIFVIKLCYADYNILEDNYNLRIKLIIKSNLY